MTEQKTGPLSAPEALDRLETLYTASVESLRQAVRTFIATGERADPKARAEGLFSYPKLRVSWFGDRPDDLAQRTNSST